MKSKLRAKITGRVKAPIKSKSPVLTNFSLYSPATSDIALRKGYLINQTHPGGFLSGTVKEALGIQATLKFLANRRRTVE